MSILVVDNEVAARALTRKILNIHGYETKEAANGIEALKTILEDDVDTVILDYLMPGMNGVELLHKIKEIRPDIASVMLTGFPSILFIQPLWKGLKEVQGIHKVT